MKLSDVIQGTKETQEDYFNRMYWNASLDRVFLYHNQQDRSDLSKEPVEIISGDEARRVLSTLKP